MGVTRSCRPLPFLFCKPRGLGAGQAWRPLRWGVRASKARSGREGGTTYLSPPCPPSHARMEWAEICIQLRNTRQLLAPRPHRRKRLGGICHAPHPTPARCQGTRAPSNPLWRRRRRSATHPPPLPQNSSLKTWPCQGEPTKTHRASIRIF